MNVNISRFIYGLAVAFITAYSSRDVLITNYTHMSFEHHVLSKCRLPTLHYQFYIIFFAAKNMTFFSINLPFYIDYTHIS